MGQTHSAPRGYGNRPAERRQPVPGEYLEYRESLQRDQPAQRRAHRDERPRPRTRSAPPPRPSQRRDGEHRDDRHREDRRHPRNGLRGGANTESLPGAASSARRPHREQGGGRRRDEEGNGGEAGIPLPPSEDEEAPEPVSPLEDDAPPLQFNIRERPPQPQPCRRQTRNPENEYRPQPRDRHHQHPRRSSVPTYDYDYDDDEHQYLDSVRGPHRSERARPNPAARRWERKHQESYWSSWGRKMRA